MAKMTVEEARELKGNLEITIKEALEDFTKETLIVVTKLTIDLHDIPENQETLIDLDIYKDVDSMAVL